MKIKLTLKLVLLILFIFVGSNPVFADSYTKMYTISAYYSPIPCQTNYSTGSYEGDIRLNGRGTNGADGTEVYAGMIAAPKTYAFGTKLFIPGLGYGTVHDRGGAIVESSGSGTYDRLDVWMGWGDPGLARALNWGKRNVEVTVFGVDASIPDDLYLASFSEFEKIPNDCNYVVPVPQAPKPVFIEESPQSTPLPVNDSTFDTDLQSGLSGAEVEKLQGELMTLNFYKGEIHGVYDDVTEHAVFKFQQSQMLVSDLSSLGAGHFGPKTRDRLNEIVLLRDYNRVLIASANPEFEPKTMIASTQNKLNKELDLGVVSDDVKVLQKFLALQGYFNGSEYTGYFGEDTFNSVLKFQLENNIISSEYDLGAGRVGPSTLKLINSMS